MQDICIQQEAASSQAIIHKQKLYTMTTSPRKGAKNMASIPADILAQLNEGTLETANLVEWLAVDQWLLLQHVLTAAGHGSAYAPLKAQWQAAAGTSVNSRMRTIGQALLQVPPAKALPKWLATLSRHPADVVRSWACYAYAALPGSSLPQQLQHLQPLAADAHFGVRETAWMALRPQLAVQLDEGIALLAPWVQHPHDAIRRFASEVTRPRGVWCAHIEVLKQEPQRALRLLQPLHADPSRYVQNSVANWLNDAAKTQPAWVQALCRTWAAQSSSAHTAYIIKRAQRSLQG